MLKILKTVLVDGLKSPLSNGHCIPEDGLLGKQVLSKYGSLVSKDPESIGADDVACLFDPAVWDKKDVRYWSENETRVLKVVEVSYNMSSLEARSGSQRIRAADKKPEPKVKDEPAPEVEVAPEPPVEAVEPIPEPPVEAVEPSVSEAPTAPKTGRRSKS